MTYLATQTDLFQEQCDGYNVRQIRPSDAHWLCLNRHYAKRIPSISYAFGLFLNDSLVGVVTYGKPPSHTLLKGICGEQYAPIVYELNRLVLLDNKPNEASRLVGASLRLLPKPMIVVSFADTKQDHNGIVYQATNFLYTGLSAKFVDPVVKGLEHQHHATYAKGMTKNQVEQKYGSKNVTWVERSRKHRYIIFLGTSQQKKKFRSALRYEILPYPKNVNINN